VRFLHRILQRAFRFAGSPLELLVGDVQAASLPPGCSRFDRVQGQFRCQQLFDLKLNPFLREPRGRALLHIVAAKRETRRRTSR
jgi:hypothetical protein